MTEFRFIEYLNKVKNTNAKADDVICLAVAIGLRSL